jgi:hypothetical protein
VLIGGVQRRVDLFIDGILWTEEILSICPVKGMISADIRKKVWIDKPKLWIVNRNLLEIMFLRIDCGSKFNKIISYWNKLTFGYSIE